MRGCLGFSPVYTSYAPRTARLAQRAKRSDFLTFERILLRLTPKLTSPIFDRDLLLRKRRKIVTNLWLHNSLGTCSVPYDVVVTVLKFNVSGLAKKRQKRNDELLSVHVSSVARPVVLPRRYIIIRLTISQSCCNTPRIGAAETSWLKRNLLLTVVGTVEARDTSRDMDNVQMIGTKITAIKEYLYVRHPHCARHFHHVCSFSDP